MARLKTNKTAIERAEKMDRALQMRREGNDLRTIANELGYKSVSGVHDLIKAGVKELYRENAEELFELQMDRLDMGMKALLPGLQMGDPKAVTALVQLHDRYSKMFHLDELHQNDTNADADAALALLNANIIAAAHQFAATTTSEDTDTE